jgi:hypothetical protein
MTRFNYPIKSIKNVYSLECNCNSRSVLHVVVLGGVMIIVLAIGQRLACSNPTENNEFLRAIKIRSTTSVVGEVKTSAPCRKILRHVKNSLRYYRDTDRQHWASISPRFATRCLLQPEQRTLVDESGKIRAQMGSTTEQKMVAVTWEALYDTIS